MNRRMLGAGRSAVAAAAVLLALAYSVSSLRADDTIPVPPKAFPTPEALYDAAIAAVEANDDAAIKVLAGSAHADLVQSGADPTVVAVRKEFLANAKTFHKLVDNEDGTKTLVVGDTRWPYPVPFRKTDAGWILDAAAGREELLARRIGRHELLAIKYCRAYPRVQAEYASKDRDGDGVREYAQRIRSTEGAHDGLYWETGDDGEDSPIGPNIEPASTYFEHHENTQPVGGYYWRILTAQGPCAPGGAHSYVINGNMIAGFALVAFPAEYRETGVMTFLVSNHGDVFQRDLGADTAKIVESMDAFNPGEGWQKVED